MVLGVVIKSCREIRSGSEASFFMNTTINSVPRLSAWLTTIADVLQSDNNYISVEIRDVNCSTKDCIDYFRPRILRDLTRMRVGFA